MKKVAFLLSLIASYYDCFSQQASEVTMYENIDRIFLGDTDGINTIWGDRVEIQAKGNAILYYNSIL